MLVNPNTILLLRCFLKYETLTREELMNGDDSCASPDREIFESSLEELLQRNHIKMLRSIEPVTYCITYEGIIEAEKIMRAEKAVK